MHPNLIFIFFFSFSDFKFVRVSPNSKFRHLILWNVVTVFNRFKDSIYSLKVPNKYIEIFSLVKIFL